MSTVACLFIDAMGVYPGLPETDCWDIKRDARKYEGAAPVVAHPPCQLWGRFAHVNYARWGGDHNKPGNDQGCFLSALNNVRRCGGVLEHPAFSDAWKHYGLPRPPGERPCSGWEGGKDDEWVCEIWQSAYGHKARKRTWLFYRGKPPMAMRWDRIEGTHQIGFHDQRGKARNKPTLAGRMASATPPDLARALIQLARTSP